MHVGESRSLETVPRILRADRGAAGADCPEVVDDRLERIRFTLSRADNEPAARTQQLVDAAERVVEHRVRNEERGQPREIEAVRVVELLNGGLHERDPPFEPGVGDVAPRDLERGLPGIHAHDRGVGVCPAERDRETCHSGADVEDPYTRRAEPGRREEPGDSGGCGALRLQQHRVRVAPSGLSRRVLDEVERLPQVRARERDDHRALPGLERVVVLAHAENVRDAIEVRLHGGVGALVRLGEAQPRGHRGERVRIGQEPVRERHHVLERHVATLSAAPLLVYARPMRGSRLRHLVDRALAIGAEPGDSQDLRFRKRLLVGIALLILPIGFVWGCVYFAFGEPIVALTPWAYVAGSIVSLAIFARNRNFAFLRTAQLLLILVAPALGVITLGSLDEASSVIVWAFLAPLGAVAFDRPSKAWPWFAAFVATLVLSLVLAEVVRPDPADLPEGFVRTFDVLNIVAVSFVAMMLLVTFARGRDAAQARADALLLNVLPEEVAQRLQSDQQSIADHFENASILFADVVDFTPLSSRLDAREVVGLLDRLFTSFDELVDRYDVEKIKTIGDCYMVAAGVPRPRSDHAHALAGLALEMQECARTCLPEPDNNLRLRIGISSGPVVAGVIGRRRFLYDLWGDTVNMASRMESHGAPDEVQITRSTWELVRDGFVTEPLGLVDVKGKGAIETWRLVGPTESSARTSA